MPGTQELGALVSKEKILAGVMRPTLNASSPVFASILRTKLLPVSATYTFPSESTATAVGPLKAGSAETASVITASELTTILRTKLLPVSATYTYLPAPSTATPWGKTKAGMAEVPRDVTAPLLDAIFLMRLFPVSAT